MSDTHNDGQISFCQGFANFGAVVKMFEFVGVPAVFSKIGIFTWLKGVSSIEVISCERYRAVRARA